MRNVSKEIFLNALVCPTLGWLRRMRREEISREPTLGEQFRKEQGIEIHRRARELYPEGFLIDDMDMGSASEKTKGLMKDPKVSTIFEGMFFVDGFITKADILKRKGKGWHLIEVKSSVNDKEEFVDDMAYTTMVIDRCGFDISTISILLISKDFRLGMKNDDLFVELDHTNEVLNRVKEFKPLWELVEKMTRQPVKPDPKLRFECRRCELFEECLGKNIENHIFDIPRLSQPKFDQLTKLGIVRIEDIPNDFPLTENQAIVRNCVQTKKPFIGNKLKNELETISWPAYYLDFETVMTAIPLYSGIAPYTQIPTQYSIHKCSEPGRVIDHFEYLADPSKDCRRELAKNLINHLKGRGSIITYGNFEKNIVTSLGRVYQDLSRELNSLVDRMVDLESIIRKNYYHPEFHGSTSIKKTLPVLVPDMSYDDLKIADGDSAMVSFAYLALGKYKDREAETIKRNLLEYCKRDSFAMVRLHQQLVKYV
ncbi:MAG TPA: DUF2779 domain-containing protein [candidate division WOR-3 bacterium]|uniref:DUF2779 domain-containing protein n=1 Tax=candidate division WOR-3 bacterium TaxID=2052148 RepID=A0A7V0LUW3_UNCW3|nr:DUF2779 domain-containing protein [candidate division WOR-3 bacterium]